ncbi:MAG: hypothetical protein JEY99_14330 [Spirochaetales bacterium]|nr:hypothetical protein [Spirochaetales bacterium]
MKKKIMMITVLVTVTVLCLGGCDLLGLLGGTSALSAVERIQAFEDDLNASYRSSSTLNSHFSDSTAQLEDMDLDWWNLYFSTDYEYEFTNILSTRATLTVTDRDSGAELSSVTVTYEMDVETDGNNLILSFSGYGTPILIVRPAF